MRIVFDNIIYSLQRYGGISVVWSNLISRIQKNDDDISYIEYDNAIANNIHRSKTDIGNKRIASLSSRWIKLKRYISPNTPKVKSKFIFHSSYYRTLSAKNAINVTTVHDFAYELFVKNFIVRFVHCWQKHRAIRNSQHIVCISENTRRDLFRFLPDVNPSKVSVIYNGIDNKYYQIKNVIHNDSLLYVGGRRGYKNFNALIKPLSELGCKLKIVGGQLTNMEKKMLDDNGLVYEFLGTVSTDTLNRLYNEAFCLLYTSSYEGFGLPVLEAQMAGCPVIALNASSIPEIIGDKRMLINSISKEQIEEKLNMLKDTEFRNAIVTEGITNANRFSWDKMAEEYYNLYKKLLHDPKHAS